MWYFGGIADINLFRDRDMVEPCLVQLKTNNPAETSCDYWCAHTIQLCIASIYIIFVIDVVNIVKVHVGMKVVWSLTTCMDKP